VIKDNRALTEIIFLKNTSFDKDLPVPRMLAYFSSAQIGVMF